MDLARDIANNVDIDTWLDWAFTIVVDTHCITSSDDMIDYCNAAAQTYAELWSIKRFGHGSDEVTAQMLGDWLSQPRSEWLAGDGDIRWFLSEYLEPLAPGLAAAWLAYIESDFDID